MYKIYPEYGLRKLVAVGLIAFLITFLISNADAIEVGGSISEDTIWGIADSPYQLTSDIYLTDGATLTIQPGVVVEMGTRWIQVGYNTAATLMADGVTFQTQQTSSNGVNFLMADASGVLQNCIFDGVRIRVHGSSPTISNCVITRNDIGILCYEYAEPMISENDIFNNSQFGLKNEGYSLLVAENNWWGHGSGPYHSTNPDGQGNAVSDNVDFSPWSPNPHRVLRENAVLYVDASQIDDSGHGFSWESAKKTIQAA